MAKARAVLQRHGDAIDIHQDELKEEDLEQALDESADPLEESGRTVDTSDEEIDENVADEIARFEDSFVGIDKRYRIINRIGEGKKRDWFALCRATT
jgi:cell division control protein 7